MRSYFVSVTVSISAVSLTGRQTWQKVNGKRRLQWIQNVQEGKDIRKKIHLAAFVVVPSVFGRSFQQLNFGLYRQKLLAGNEEENSQMFMRTFACRSTFLYGISVADPWHFCMNPDPAIFIIGLTRRQQKTNFCKKFFCFLLFERIFTSLFTEKKVIKKSQNRRYSGFSYYFCLMI